MGQGLSPPVTNLPSGSYTARKARAVSLQLPAHRSVDDYPGQVLPLRLSPDEVSDHRDLGRTVRDDNDVSRGSEVDCGDAIGDSELAGLTGWTICPAIVFARLAS